MTVCIGVFEKWSWVTCELFDSHAEAYSESGSERVSSVPLSVSSLDKAATWCKCAICF